MAMRRCQVACGWLEIVMNAANVMEFGFLGSIKAEFVEGFECRQLGPGG